MAESSRSRQSRRLEALLLQEPSDELRDSLFLLVIEMKGEAAMTQREVAGMLSMVHAVWSMEVLGDQAARLKPLEDVIDVVCGLAGMPSPLYGETLEEADKPPPKVDGEFLAASKRAAESVAQSCGNTLAKLEAQEASIRQELEVLLSEARATNCEFNDLKHKIGATVVVYEDPARRKMEQLQELREESGKLRRWRQVREEAEQEFAAFAAEEALIAEELRAKAFRQ
mmetsp:Transcript_135912/g.378779  ORF Transcript_135912/g.378779 Transcript_135912/m.378779 type:complete len:227 (+) Transcript_135912:38-718(+)